MKSVLSKGETVTLGWLWALAATLVVLVVIVLPPALPIGPRTLVMSGFHMLCHQLPERSFALDGVPLAVCHRCLGIYAGLVLGVLVAPLVKTRPSSRRRFEGLVLVIAVLPAAIDWGGDAVGLWANTPWMRTGTGLWFGVMAGLLLARSVLRPEVQAQPVRSRTSGRSPR